LRMAGFAGAAKYASYQSAFAAVPRRWWQVLEQMS